MLARCIRLTLSTSTLGRTASECWQEPCTLASAEQDRDIANGITTFACDKDGDFRGLFILSACNLLSRASAQCVAKRWGSFWCSSA